ncbi:MAG: radical SAM protein [Candidatus Azambacteria bacterium]|nr:radical SAM protein [Candidatus Azambacteria bacterium]
MKRKKMNVMILPVGVSCNLNCKYCYHSGLVNTKVEVMPENVLSRIIRGTTELADDVDFFWHGGEPLLARESFYRKALLMQKETRFTGIVRNIIQTNATLINDKWADFLTKNHFLIGVSIDGPKSLHDLCRVNKGNKGTYNEVVRGVRKIQERQRNVGCIALITRYNVCHPEEVWRNIRTLGISNLALHFCSSTRWGNSDEFMSSPKETVAFCKKLFNLWVKEDDPSFRIRNFVNVIRADNGSKPLDCAHQSNACRFFIAIDQQGNAFPCHRFANDVTKRIGNINNQELKDILDSSKEVYAEMAALPNDCKRCKHLKACGNGCAYERLIANGLFRTKHPACAINKNIIRHIQNWENKQ